MLKSEFSDLIYTDYLAPQEGFALIFQAYPEYSAPDWDFENEQEKQELLDKIDRGDLIWFVGRVIATKNNIVLGESILGGLCFESYSEAIADPFLADLIHEALTNAKENIKGLIDISA